MKMSLLYLKHRAVLVQAMFFLVACPKSAEEPTPTLTNPSEAPPSDLGGLQLAVAENLSEAPDRVRVALEAQVSQHVFRMGIPTEVWSFNQNIPGPLIRLHHEQRLTVTFTNGLNEPLGIAISGYGSLSAPNGCSEGSERVPSGATCLLEAPQLSPGLYYYYATPRTEETSERGLAGPILVEAGRPPNDRDWPEDEAFVVFDDVRLDALAQIETLTPAHPLDRWENALNGRLGNVLLVNGALSPHIVWPDGKSLRVHLWNLSGAQMLRLSSTEHTFHQTSSARSILNGTKSWPHIPLVYVTDEMRDGGIFESGQVLNHGDVDVPPRVMSDGNPENGVTLAPGQRLSLIWTPRATTDDGPKLEWHDAQNGKYHAFLENDGGVTHKAGYGDGWRPPRYLVNTQLTKNDEAQSWRPSTPFATTPFSENLTKLHIELSEVHPDGGLVQGFHLTQLDEVQSLEAGVYELWIDNRTHTEHYLQFEGATLRVKEVNDSHGNPSALPAGNLGTIDTVLVGKATAWGTLCRTVVEVTIHDPELLAIHATVLSRVMTQDELWKGE